MSLIEQLKELPKEKSVNMDDLENLRPEQEEEHDPEETHEEEIDDKEEDSKPEKPEVSGYQRRKVKQADKAREDAELRATAAHERADRLERQMADTMAKLAERTERREEPVNKEPDPNTDPDGYVKYKLEQPGVEIKKLSDSLKEMQIQTARANATAELSRREAEYAKKDPDYFDAIEFGFQRELSKQRLLNPNFNEVQARSALEREKLEVAAHFANQGKDPVASIKQLMVESYGYSPKETPKEKENFDAVRKNKANSATSLSAGGRNGSEAVQGSDSARQISLKDFAKMDKTQKDRVFADKVRR